MIWLITMRFRPVEQPSTCACVKQPAEPQGPFGATARS